MRLNSCKSLLQIVFIILVSNSASAERLELARDLVVALDGKTHAAVFKSHMNCVYLATAVSKRVQTISFDIRAKYCVSPTSSSQESQLSYKFDVMSDTFQLIQGQPPVNRLEKGFVIEMDVPVDQPNTNEG